MDSEIAAHERLGTSFDADAGFADYKTRPTSLTFKHHYLSPDSGSLTSSTKLVAGTVRVAIASSMIAILAAGVRLADAVLQTDIAYIAWRQTILDVFIDLLNAIGISEASPEAILGWIGISLSGLAFAGALIGGTFASIAFIYQRHRMRRVWRQPAPFWPVSPGFKGVTVSVGQRGIALTSGNSSLQFLWEHEIDYNAMIRNDIVNPGLGDAYSAPDDLVMIDRKSDLRAAREALGDHAEAVRGWARSAECLRIPLLGHGFSVIGTGKKQRKSIFFATAAFPKALFHQGFSFEDFVILCTYHAARSGEVNNAR